MVDSVVLQSFSRRRLLIREVTASKGVGERRSKSKGAGIEFVDFRSYSHGDDLRHLDPQIFARLGQHQIRQYEVQKQLRVTILIDLSRSMEFGVPSKAAFATTLGSYLAYVALAGGDSLRTLVWTGARLEVSPWFQGSGRAAQLFQWLKIDRGCGGGGFEDSCSAACKYLPAKGLIIVLSDWWMEDCESFLQRISSRGRQEVWAFRILTAEEEDPSLLGADSLRFEDSETGQEIEMQLGKSVFEAYALALAGWGIVLDKALSGIEGRYIPVRTGSDFGWLLPTLQRLGMISS